MTLTPEHRIVTELALFGEADARQLRRALTWRQRLAGELHPTLERLHARGVIAWRWAGGRRVYRLVNADC